MTCCFTPFTDRQSAIAAGRCLRGLLLACLALFVGCEQSSTPSARYEVAAQGLFSADLSLDSEQSVIGSLNHGGSLWRNSGHERLFGWNLEAGKFSDFAAVAFSSDGSRAVMASPRSAVVWDTGSGRALAYWGSPGTILSAGLSEFGEKILLGLSDHSALIVDANTGAHRGTLMHEGPVGQIKLSSDNQWIFTGSDDATAVLWRFSDQQAVTRLKLDNPVRQVAISSTGRFLFTASFHGSVGLYEGSSGSRLHQLYKTNPGISSARFSEDESRLLVGFINAKVELWDVFSGQRLRQWNAKGRQHLRRGGNAILAAGFKQPTGPFLALGSDGHLLELR